MSCSMTMRLLTGSSKGSFWIIWKSADGALAQAVMASSFFAGMLMTPDARPSHIAVKKRGTYWSN